MNRALAMSVVLTAAVVVYLVLLAGRAVALLGMGEPVPVLLGAGVLLLPLLGIWVLLSTWRSGLSVARLTRELEAEGGLPDVSGLPRMPSGRVDRAAADEWFAERKAEVDANPDDWRAWYRLAHAYDIAGDRRRARDTMRKAIQLSR
ncbi:MAG: hypothetical protein GEU86_05055 [Actinophytocola sp.]|nr:hypothetical protein [Actinophytocola sp.]